MPTKREARAIILNGQQVTLLSGTQITIRPWSIEQRDHLLPPLAEMVREVQNAGAEAYDMDTAAFLLKHSAQIENLVQLTLGWSDEEFNQLALEDYLALTRVVLDVCIIRPDGGGPLGELLRLSAMGPRAISSVIYPALLDIAVSKLDSTSSSATTSPRSGDGVTVLKRSEATLPS